MGMSLSVCLILSDCCQGGEEICKKTSKYIQCLFTYWVKTSLRINGSNCVQLKCLFAENFCFHSRDDWSSNFALSPLSLCRKIFSDDKGKLEEAELSNALTEIAAEHNSVIQTNTTESKA